MGAKDITGHDGRLSDLFIRKDIVFPFPVPFLMVALLYANATYTSLKASYPNSIAK